MSQPWISVVMLLLCYCDGPTTTAVTTASEAQSLDALTVCPPSVGCLKGTICAGYQADRFEAFMGIPYALPPVGELRFSVGSVTRHPRLLTAAFGLSEPEGDAEAARSLQCQSGQDGLHPEELPATHPHSLRRRRLSVSECLSADQTPTI